MANVHCDYLDWAIFESTPNLCNILGYFEKYHFLNAIGYIISIHFLKEMSSYGLFLFILHLVTKN